MINRLEFSIDISAEKAIIWKALWDENYYRDWAGVFYKGSYFVSDRLKEGSRIMFLAPDKSGIYSTIVTHVPNHIIEFKHIGMVVEGKEQPVDGDTKKWSGATEIYSLNENEGTGTITLLIQIDVLDEHVNFMSAKFPEALEMVKKNCGKLSSG